jgi:four helix bundle protein
MSRDHRKLRVFQMADLLVSSAYKASSQFPFCERFGLQTQVRRAAVSTACNIVEGCARRTTGEYVNFLSVAAGSAAETRYLIDLAARLNFLGSQEANQLRVRYEDVSAGLQALISSLRPKS